MTERDHTADEKPHSQAEHQAILLVDDEPAVRALLHRVMRDLALRYDLITASDGATALTLLVQQPVALVITDLRMPDMDGIALAVEIKAHLPDCPIILLTGYPSPEVQQRAAATGVAFLVTKPFRLEDFAAVVQTALGR